MRLNSIQTIEANSVFIEINEEDDPRGVEYVYSFEMLLKL
jgi:hypothetical protein